MVKRYYCDFCNKSFQDNIQSRRRHLKGISHQRNRRLHYDAVMREQAAVQQQAHNAVAGVLHSNFTGEEILQQWLAKHPEVVKKYQKIQDEKKKRPDTKECSDSAKCGKAQEDRRSQEETACTPNLSLIKTDDSIPPDLEPFKDILPPSLLPHAMRRKFPGSCDPAEWG